MQHAFVRFVKIFVVTATIEAIKSACAPSQVKIIASTLFVYANGPFSGRKRLLLSRHKYLHPDPFRSAEHDVACMLNSPQ